MQDLLAALQQEKSSYIYSIIIFVISLVRCPPTLDAQGRRSPLCTPLLLTLKYHLQSSSGRENCATVDPCNFEPYILFFSFLK